VHGFGEFSLDQLVPPEDSLLTLPPFVEECLYVVNPAGTGQGFLVVHVGKNPCAAEGTLAGAFAQSASSSDGKKIRRLVVLYQGLGNGINGAFCHPPF